MRSFGGGPAGSAARAIGVLLAMAGVLSCATKRIRTYEGDALALTEIAVLHEPSVAITLEQIDGNQVESSTVRGFEYELKPGRHEITANFSVDGFFRANFTCTILLYANPNMDYLIMGVPLDNYRRVTIKIFETKKSKDTSAFAPGPAVSACSK